MCVYTHVCMRVHVHVCACVRGAGRGAARGPCWRTQITSPCTPAGVCAWRCPPACVWWMCPRLESREDAPGCWGLWRRTPLPPSALPSPTFASPVPSCWRTNIWDCSGPPLGGTTGAPFRGCPHVPLCHAAAPWVGAGLRDTWQTRQGFWGPLFAAPGGKKETAPVLGYRSIWKSPSADTQAGLSSGQAGCQQTDGQTDGRASQRPQHLLTRCPQPPASQMGARLTAAWGHLPPAFTHPHSRLWAKGKSLPGEEAPVLPHVTPRALPHAEPHGTAEGPLGAFPPAHPSPAAETHRSVAGCRAPPSSSAGRPRPHQGHHVAGAPRPPSAGDEGGQG